MKNESKSVFVRHQKLVTIQAAADPTRKCDGETAEAQFLARACRLGFAVAKPWGDSARYDFLIDTGPRLWRMQVKSTRRFFNGRYCVKSGSYSAAYSSDEIDFLVAYIVPEDLWYVVPIEAIAPRFALYFYPHAGSRSRYERYREAWCLLSCKPTARGWEDIPARCRSKELSARCAVCPLRSPCGTDTPVRCL
jgi:hypothetical protein